MIGGLKTQVRVISSLILREARVRHGRSRLGYLWAIIEPAALVILLTVLFSQVRVGVGVTANFALFFALGVLPFQMFRTTTEYVSQSILANRPLFNYLPVKPFDAILARWILETCTIIIVMVLVLSFQVLVLDAPTPGDFKDIALILMLIAQLSLGMGMCLSICRVAMPVVAKTFSILMGPAFFLSCVFYSLQVVPTEFRNILVWNPLVHVTEGFRASYIDGYRAPDVDLVYLFVWGFSLCFIGSFSYVVVSRTNQA